MCFKVLVLPSSVYRKLSETKPPNSELTLAVVETGEVCPYCVHVPLELILCTSVLSYYVCIRITHTYVRMYFIMCTCIHVHNNTQCTYVRTYVRTYAHYCIGYFIDVCLHTCLQMYTYTFIRTYVQVLQAM